MKTQKVTKNELVKVIGEISKFSQELGYVSGTHPFEGNLVVLVMNSEILKALNLSRPTSLRITAFEVELSKNDVK